MESAESLCLIQKSKKELYDLLKTVYGPVNINILSYFKHYNFTYYKIKK